MIKLSGPTVFKWSASEQVYPFEQDVNGNTLYCKEVAFGALPNTGTKSIAHNITGLNLAKIFKLQAICSRAAIARECGAVEINIAADTTYVVIETASNYSGYGTCAFRIVYAR